MLVINGQRILASNIAGNIAGPIASPIFPAIWYSPPDEKGVRLSFPEKQEKAIVVAMRKEGKLIERENTAPPIRFQPVIVRTVSFNFLNDEAFLDLDTGRFGKKQPGNDIIAAAGESDMRVRAG